MNHDGKGPEKRDGLTVKELAVVSHLKKGETLTEAARSAGYLYPKDEAKRLRTKAAFTQAAIAELRTYAVRYHQLVDLSKKNIAGLLALDSETDAKTRATLSLGVLKLLRLTSKDGKSLVDTALEEDAREMDPRVIAERLLSEGTPAGVIDVTPRPAEDGEVCLCYEGAPCTKPPEVRCACVAQGRADRVEGDILLPIGVSPKCQRAHHSDRGASGEGDG